MILAGVKSGFLELEPCDFFGVEFLKRIFGAGFLSNSLFEGEGKIWCLFWEFFFSESFLHMFLMVYINLEGHIY